MGHSFAFTIIPRIIAAHGALQEREQEILTAAAPLIQTRIQLLRECRDMLGFLFVDDADLVVDDAAVGGLRDSAPAVLDAAIGALEGPEDTEWTTSRLWLMVGVIWLSRASGSSKKLA